MRGFGIMLAYGLTIVGCVGIGAWLVVQGHPWFGLLAMLISGTLSYEEKPNPK